jgi:hypothetical protein
MFKDVLNHLGGFTGYAEVGLVIFFAVFVLVAVRAVLTPKQVSKRWSELPLKD